MKLAFFPLVTLLLLLSSTKVEAQTISDFDTFHSTDTVKSYKGQTHIAKGCEPTIAGFVFEDVDIDQQYNPSLPGIEGVQVSCGTRTTFTNENGWYELSLDLTSTPITITYDESVWPVSTTPIQVTYDPSQNYYNFGLNSDEPVCTLELMPDPGNPYFCQTNMHQSFYIQNTGNQLLGGEIAVNHDPTLTPHSYIPAPQSMDGNQIIFDIPSLGLNETFSVYIEYEGQSEKFLGEELTTTIGLSYRDQNNNLITSDTLTNVNSILCAYEPNDMYGFPLGTGEQGYIAANTPLKYRIRFQNTGNQTVENIEVIDTIPETLDLASFNPLPSSHPASVQVNQETRVVRWTLANINLPDSASDPAGSQGAIWYTINMNNLDIGDEILNRAFVYFYQNIPNETNTSLHTIQENISIPTIDKDFPAAIYPNPVNDRLTLRFEQSAEGSILVFDLQGRKCLETSVNATELKLDISQLERGIYLLRFREKNHSTPTTTQFVKM